MGQERRTARELLLAAFLSFSRAASLPLPSPTTYSGALLTQAPTRFEAHYLVKPPDNVVVGPRPRLWRDNNLFNPPALLTLTLRLQLRARFVQAREQPDGVAEMAFHYTLRETVAVNAVVYCGRCIL
jgi:hypothetical protein